MLKLYRDMPLKEVQLKQWQFPAGETGIKVEGKDLLGEKDVTIFLSWEGNNDLMALGQLVDALRHAKVGRISLVIPYFPYSRQDRRCNPGEGHALKVVAGYINSLNFSSVQTWDAHSTVLEALVDNLAVVPQHICAWDIPEYDCLIAPDAGASKKIMLHEQVIHGGTKVVIADKTRGQSGVISELIIPNASYLTGQRVCVVDDLCDGGATFIAVSDALEGVPCAVLDLYVTHGIFSKGLDELSKRYQTIYTANLMNPALKGQVKELH